jgi:HEAT repeat protein
LTASPSATRVHRPVAADVGDLLLTAIRNRPRLAVVAQSAPAGLEQQVDDDEGVAAALADANREVRIAVANGIGTLGTGGAAVQTLIEDRDPLVRAAALAAMGSVQRSDGDAGAVERALAASAWQIRQGAARALAGARAPSAAVPPLSRALGDPHLDVRKAAVLSLTRWVASESAARDALTGALDDGDADVRAYARQALAAVM